MNPSPETVGMAVALLATMGAYALFAGADFGGGIWDLLAGGPRRGERPRAAIDASVTPVWEGNQVWIVIGLVFLWTAFSPAFAAVMTTLFIPLSLSALGIVLRGVGFAFRHEAERLPARALTGALFASASLLTPFFLGTAVGAVATGQVRYPRGDELASWIGPTPLLTGFLFVSSCAFVAAVYLVGDSHRRGEEDMVGYFSRRAIASGLLTGALAAGNLTLMHWTAPYLFARLTGPALPMVVVSGAAGVGALVVVLLRRIWLLRILAALAVAAVVAGWGWAQYPWLLPRTLSLSAGSAPLATLWAEFAVLGMAVLLVVPAFGYLYWLQQHGELEETASAELRAAVAQQRRADPVVPAARPTTAGRVHPLLVAAVFAAAAVDWLREAFRRRQGAGAGRRR